MNTTVVVANHLSKAAVIAETLTLRDLTSSRIEQEPPITDRLAARLADAINDYPSGKITWHAKTFTDRGPNSQESKFGPDLLGTLSVQTTEYDVKKGFLAQAKLVEPDEPFSATEYAKLKGQCAKMLTISPASYVFLYSSRGFVVFPALAVVSSSQRNPHDFDAISLDYFFFGHGACFFGDRRLSNSDITKIEEIRREYDARVALSMIASQL